MFPWFGRRLALRLALLYFAIVLAAILVVYFYVAPRLESRLTDEKLHTLSTAAQQYSGPVVHALGSQLPVKSLDKAVRQAGDRANARTTLLGVSKGSEGLRLYPISDSTTDVPISDLQFQVANDALATKRVQTGEESSNDGQVAQAARPLTFNGKVAYVLVYSAPLSDVQSNVALIRRQIRVAGAIALAIALIAGYLVARALARRVKRLEVAAEKVAAGDFSEPIPVDSDDELGQLAIAFNDMQRQLARLDSARKQFIAIASHELRTPIFSLGGFVELLQDEDLDEETRAEFLAQMRDQIERMTHLATELLDLSRLEAGSLELRPERVALCELTRQVSGEFAPAVAHRGSRLSVRVPRDEIEANCDPDRVAQIIRILLDNALTHTPNGTDIEVATARDNGVVKLAVTDSGPGIKRPALPHIFEPFYSADDAQGAGLGLAIARELAERMAGRLSVESGSGGTTFTLELPT
jgi:signal transduction histidine kinase